VNCLVLRFAPVRVKDINRRVNEAKRLSFEFIGKSKYIHTLKTSDHVPYPYSCLFSCYFVFHARSPQVVVEQNRILLCKYPKRLFDFLLVHVLAYQRFIYGVEKAQ
jgi:hypothetical protein